MEALELRMLGTSLISKGNIVQTVQRVTMEATCAYLHNVFDVFADLSSPL